MTTKEETFKINGEQLLVKFKELIKEGNVRRIIIKSKEGKTIVEFPLTIGVVGAIAALITECEIVVERGE